MKTYTEFISEAVGSMKIYTLKTDKDIHGNMINKVFIKDKDKYVTIKGKSSKSISVNLFTKSGDSYKSLGIFAQVAPNDVKSVNKEFEVSGGKSMFDRKYKVK